MRSDKVYNETVTNLLLSKLQFMKLTQPLPNSWPFVNAANKEDKLHVIYAKKLHPIDTSTAPHFRQNRTLANSGK